MDILDPENRERDTEEEYEGGDDLEDQSPGPAIPDDVRRKLLADWGKLEG